jgi:acetylornithine deacetylase
MLAKLVGFPTVSTDSNLDLIRFVEDYLSGLGVTCTLVPDATREKASLFANIGPQTGGGVVLSAHTDVVPTTGQNWTSDPFTLTERDGRLFGRGACDMKGFAAVALAMVPEMLAANLKHPIQIALSYDEENGCLGAPPMIEAMRASLPAASAVIVGEPTLMKTVTGHKGILELHTHVTGYEVHSSLLHKGVPAVMVAARLISWHDDRSRENATHPDEDSGYDPPWTTLHVGRVEGGTVHNITAGHCYFTTDVRTIPSESTADWLKRYREVVAGMEAEMKAIHPGAGVRIEVIADVPGCRAEPDGAAEALVRSLTGDNATEVVSYATEAGQFQEGGYSTVVCGPGSIEQAHQPDEYIEVSQIEACEAFVRRLIAKLAA